MSTKKLKGDRFEIAMGDPLYPKAFDRLAKPPKMLYGIGNPRAMEEGLAIVGARRATPYGIGCAKRFAGIAAERGVVIISGGARGCDSASHEAAISRGAKTVAILGGGCDEIYPPEHFGLFQKIIDSGGFVVSENPFGFKPLPYTFRERNRLIASLAKATLIVEAGLPSGTFSTADEALSADREVLVVPGSITSKSSMGANRLIYQGATPIVDDDTFADQLFLLFGHLKQEGGEYEHDEAGTLDARTRRIYESLSAQPMSLEEIQNISRDVSYGADFLPWLMQTLLTLQSENLISLYPDGRYGPIVKDGG